MGYLTALVREDGGYRLAAVLAVGDVLAIGTFVVVGVVHHGGHPLTAIDRVVGSLAPFLLGWAVVASLAGLYRRETAASLRDGIARAGLAWLGAASLGLVLRATPVFPGSSPPTFALVAIGAGGGLVVGWRLLAGVVLARRGWPGRDLVDRQGG